MDLSIVTTLYYSAPYLEEFYNRIRTAAQKITGDYEIIFVNDSSPDNSLDIAISLYEKDDRVRVIDLSRNFGQHKAMVAGLAHAKGELIFLIDCDLEEEPELLEKFHSAIRDSGADVVYGVRDTRESQLFERITANLFYKLFNLLSSYPVPSHPLNTRLMSKQYVASLLEHKEREFYMAGLWAMTGFKQVPFIARKHSKGSSSYTLRRKISIFVNAITSFSNQPLIFIFYVGCAILISSIISALYLIVRRIFYDVLLTGWPSLMVSLWFLGGMTIFCLGLIGIYLSKIFLETKQRPYAIIRQIYEKNIDGGLNTSGG
jgi:putative glycosyltransferase